MGKILIIDDEPTMCQYLAVALRKKTNMDVKICSEYNHLDKLLELGFNAVILDVVMPFDKHFFPDLDIEIQDDDLEFKTGIFLFKKIRKKYPKLPIIFYTALQESFECDGRSMMINKPNLAENVAESINDFIKKCERLE